MVDERPADWLRWDLPKDVLSSLAELKRSLSVIQVDQTAWKWAVLALHNALQSAITCHLIGTEGVGHLSENCARKWLSYNQNPEADEPKHRHQASSKDLFQRLSQHEKRVEQAWGSILQISDDQDNSFNSLHELRGEFAHFKVDGWSLDLSILPNIFWDILAVITMIADDDQTFRHMDSLERIEISSLLNELSSSIWALLNPIEQVVSDARP